MNRKVSPVFIFLFLEIVITFLLYFWRGCGSPCDPHSFLNPLGISENKILCMTVCDYSKPFPFFYLAFDITVVTLILFLALRIFKLIRKKK